MCLTADNDADAEITLKNRATQEFAVVSWKWSTQPYLSSAEM